MSCHIKELLKNMKNIDTLSITIGKKYSGGIIVRYHIKITNLKFQDTKRLIITK
jgi:hypothetical protein